MRYSKNIYLTIISSKQYNKYSRENNSSTILREYDNTTGNYTWVITLVPSYTCFALNMMLYVM
jgi:hypothetical protein